jgi:hypothetical protein
MLIGSGFERYLHIRPYWQHVYATGPEATEYPLIKLRITISAYPPTGDSRLDVSIKNPSVSHTWTSPTTGVGWYHGEAKSFPLSPFNYCPFVYLIAEGNIGAYFGGYSQIIEGARGPAGTDFRTNRPVQTGTLTSVF